MKAKLFDALQILAAITITTGMVAYAAPVPPNEVNSNAQNVVSATNESQPAIEVQEPVASPEVAKNEVSDPNGCEPEQYWDKEPPYSCIPKPTTNPSAGAVTTTSPPASATSNEAIIWNFLIGQGFPRHQAAAIMGNLQQEHNFKTDDVPGGLGIAQWMGGRRAALMAKGNYTDIHVQLNFMMEELNGSERAAGAKIRNAPSVEAATEAFQNLYERCNPTYCHYQQRVNYAYAILNKY